MDADTLVADVEDACATELDRLGSEKLLLALTGADLSTAAVLTAAARSERAARDTFAAWAEDEPDTEAAAAFEAAVDREADHYRRVLAELDGEPDPGGTDAMHAHLRSVEGTVERVAAGFVGRVLVADRTHLQVVSFFVNEADETRADLFRDLRSETGAALGTGRALLDERCEGDDWDRAREAARETVLVAYEEYADALDGMGLDPKPLC